MSATKWPQWVIFLGMAAASFTALSAPVAFNDNALLNAVKAQWEAATGETLSTPPQDTELADARFAALNARGLGIADLTGLQACASLANLNLGMNQISDLTPLSGLTALVHLDLGFGVNMMDDDEIDPLQTGTNLISDISPLATLVNLEYLSIMGNAGITSIVAFSTMDSLAELWMSTSPIEDLGPLADVADTLTFFASGGCGMENSDIAILNGLTHLQGFALWGENNVSDLSGLTAIRPTFLFVLFYMTQVTDISVVSNYTTLQMLMVEECPITAIPDLSGMTHLQHLSMPRNQLTDISGLAGNTSLREIELQQNQISDIGALASCTDLESINLNDNLLTDIQPLLDHPNVANIHYLNLRDNPFLEGTPFCDENQLAQFKTLNTNAEINSNALCGPLYSLTLSVNGAGTTSPEPGVIAVPQDTFQYVSARPISGSGQAFENWSGDISSSEISAQIFMDSDKSITANFVPGDWTLTINKTGAAAGSTWPNPGAYSYLNGQTASVSADNKAGAYFNGWSGTATGFANSVNILMDADKTITADFVSSGYALTLHTEGDGHISGFYENDSYYYAFGAHFDLQAQTYSMGYRFDHWEGDIPSGTDISAPILPVVMDQNRDLTAVFVLDVKTLTIIIEGGGSTTPTGSSSPGTQYTYATGQGACVYALGNAGAAFDHWEGDIGGSNPYNSNLCVTMDQDHTLTAVFLPADWVLTLLVEGNGTTNPSPGVYGYTDGAQANINYQLVSGGDAFGGWSGDINPGSEQNPWNMVTMDRHRTITANFVPGTWTLTLSRSGVTGGGTNPNSGTYAYLEGQTAAVNTYTNTSAYFAGWTGDVIADTPYLNIPMDGNKFITANFASSGYTLNVSRQGNGEINLYGTFYLASGMEPVLKATGRDGGIFSEWTGDLPDGADADNPEMPVLMDQDRSITGVFVRDTNTLTIIIEGSGSTDPAGSAAPGTSYEYTPGQYICIQALAGANGAFSYWSGDTGGANIDNSRLCFNMDQDRTIMAHFVAVDYTLTLVASGNGTTNPVPGIYGYVTGTWVNFNAVLLPGGDAFSHWSGDIDTSNPGSFNAGAGMAQNRTITANFVPGDYTLTLDKSGPSSGGVSPDPGTYAYLDGQTIDVHASNNSSAYFAGWSGDVDSDTPDITVVMDGNKDITANFADSGFILTISTEGQGWINLPSLSYFASGTEPMIIPHLASGWNFDHWSGDLPSGTDPTIFALPVLMDQNRNITAHFVQDQRTLTVIIVGEGSTSPEGGPTPGVQHIYTAGSQVWAVAALGTGGWAFGGWSGDIGSADSLRQDINLTMDQDRTIVATYLPADWAMTLGFTGNGSIYPAPGTYGFVDGANAEAVANILNGGDAFDHWEGLPEGEDPAEGGHHFAIHGNLTLTAVFMPGDYTLTTDVAGGGTAEYVSHPSGVYSYMAGRTASIEVRPRPTTYWGGYSGDVNTYDYTCSLLMNANKDVTITLGTSGYELVVNPIGGGLTSPSGAWRFVAGATPTIHAMDQSSALFDYWSGELPAGVDPNARDIQILMDHHRTVFANFTEADWYLYLQVQGSGTIDPAPALYWHREGDAFEVTAAPGADALFLHWTGNVPEGQDPTSLTISGTMTQNREIIAVFVPQTVAVPDLSGKTQAEAEAVLMNAGLVLGAVAQEYSSTVPASQVISQDPDAEAIVVYGSAVSIVISLGSCYTSIPNVAGLSTAEAHAALTTANMATGAITFELSETVPEGQVISQNPVSGLVVECGTAIDLVVSGASPEGGEEGEGEGETGCHTADQNCDGLVNLSELLRVIQFFNSGGYHCESGTEDGYAPGLGDTNCTPHASDYNTQDWLINLSELLRLIQFFNSGGYHYCPGENTEDGFCPGVGAE